MSTFALLLAVLYVSDFFFFLPTTAFRLGHRIRIAAWNADLGRIRKQTPDDDDVLLMSSKIHRFQAARSFRFLTR